MSKTSDDSLLATGVGITPDPTLTVDRGRRYSALHAMIHVFTNHTKHSPPFLLVIDQYAMTGASRGALVLNRH